MNTIQQSFKTVALVFKAIAWRNACTESLYDIQDHHRKDNDKLYSIHARNARNATGFLDQLTGCPGASAGVDYELPKLYEQTIKEILA